jgi:hypothetical protein
MQKKLSVSLVALLILATLLLGYLYVPRIETTQVSLKCEEKKFLIEKQPTETSYLRLTRKFLNDYPYRLLSSYPDFDEENYPPYISGYSEKSPEVVGVTFKQEHFYPTWYVFVTPSETEERKIPRLQFVTYLNRQTLEVESYFLSGEELWSLWSKGTCEVVPNAEFDDDYIKRKETVGRKSKI